MTEDIIIQSEREKRDKNQISEKKLQNLPDFEWNKTYNASDFELKVLQRVRFSIKKFTTRQIPRKNIFLKSTILKKIFFKKARFWRKKYF